MSTISALIQAVSDLAIAMGNALQLRGFKEGGTAGQVPVKINGTDFNWSWQTPAGGDALTTGTLDQFADVTQALGATLAIPANAVISGTNTGDQTSIVGITGTISQFNTALTDGDFATLGGIETLSNKTIADPTVTGTMTADSLFFGGLTTYGTLSSFLYLGAAAEAHLAALGLPSADQVAVVQRLAYDPLNADQDGVTVSGTLGYDGTPITTPAFVPETDPGVYENADWQIIPDADFYIQHLTTTAEWLGTGGTLETTSWATYNPDTTGIPLVTLTTRPKTTGDFCFVDDEIRPPAAWKNLGTDLAPNWQPYREGYANATHASGTLTLTAANAGTSRITTSTGASAFSIVPTADLPYDANNALVWIITQGGAGVGTVDDTDLTVSFATGAGLDTPGQNKTMILRQTGVNSYLLSGGVT